MPPPTPPCHQIFKNRAQTRIPTYFLTFLDIWRQTDASVSSASKFPAQGAGQNSIWSHIDPNQDQNHVLVKCACFAKIGLCQEAMPCRPSWILPDKTPMCSGVGCLRRFFSRKMQPLDFGHADQAKFSTMFEHFLTEK